MSPKRVGQIADNAWNIRFMVAFLNHAYNTADAEKTLAMSNDEKTGGILFFGYLDDRVSQLCEQIEALQEKTE